MTKLLKEPLVHFLALGALIFVGYGMSAGGGPANDEIVVSSGQQQQLVVGFEKTWSRPPDQRELARLIDEWIREEIAYREGIAMNLDGNDTIIRRRLRQKLELLSEELVSPVAEPTDTQLEAFRAAHEVEYGADPRFTFTQMFFDAEQGAGNDARMERALSLLADGADSSVIGELGDVNPLPARWRDEPDRVVAANFGRDFLMRLETLPVGQWSGPVRSAYGLHLVKLDRRVAGRALTLAEARPQVLRDWERRQRIDALDRFYSQLRERYRITIEPLARPVAGDPG